jgi:hypothetical protein
MLNALRIVLVLSLMNFLSACQKDGQGGPSPQQRAIVEGPSDGGGGDTCNGKMIESYRADISGLDEYKEFVQPILFKLIASDGKGTASPFLLSAKLKNWYILDCKLQDIPKNRKGLFLESYQTAIHTGREVFIDSVSYSSMAKEEKAKLLLHEMVMGYYLMKYMPLADICKASGNCSSDVLRVANWKIVRPLPYVPLNAEDHQKIRAVTAWLWEQGDHLSLEAFTKVLENNDFDKRFSLFNGGESKETYADPETIVRVLKKYQWTQAFPKFCQFDPETNVSKGTCQTQVQAGIRDLSITSGHSKEIFVKLKLTRDSDQKVYEQELTYPLVAPDQKVRLYSNKFGPILKATPIAFTANWPALSGKPLEEGMKSQMLMVMLNFADPENPEIYQMNFDTFVWYSFVDETVTKEDGKYITTYGYSARVEAESETLFMENELPFSFQMKIPGKIPLKTQPVP